MAIEFGPKDRYRTYGVPSLDLPFADRKSLVDRISGNNLITFTRSTTGTYVGSDGLIKTAAVNEPRFDHNPLTRESLGLLVEEARTNLHVGSTTNALNSINALTQGSASIVDPTGATSTVETWTADTSTGSHSGYRFYNNTYVDNTYSLFVKSNGITRIQVSANQRDSSTYIDVDLISGSIISMSDNRATAVKLTNGWVRISSSAGSNRAHGPGFWLLDSSGNRSFTGNGTSGVYVWGMQLEQASGALFPTSYIPTTGSTVTRAADVASITGSNFSSWYNQSEGTLFQNCISRAPIGGPGGSNAGVGMLVTNSTTGASIGFFRRADSTSLEISVYTGSVTSAFFSNASQWPQNIASKAALAYKTNDFAASANGLTVQTDTLGTVPTATQLDIGQMSTATYNRIGGGTFSRLTYYPNRLPDTTLQALTKL